MNSYVVSFLAAAFSAVCALILIAAVKILDPNDTNRH
jgi:hypothetical protein